jgi:hypothetical protein
MTTRITERGNIITSRVKPKAREAPRGFQRSTIARWHKKKEKKIRVMLISVVLAVPRKWLDLPNLLCEPTMLTSSHLACVFQLKLNYAYICECFK